MFFASVMPEVPQGRSHQWGSETINCSVDLPVVSFDLKKKAGRYPYRPAPMLKTSTVCRGFAKKVPVFGAGTAVSHDVTQA